MITILKIKTEIVMDLNTHTAATPGEVKIIWLSIQIIIAKTKRARAIVCSSPEHQTNV